MIKCCLAIIIGYIIGLERRHQRTAVCSLTNLLPTSQCIHHHTSFCSTEHLPAQSVSLQLQPTWEQTYVTTYVPSRDARITQFLAGKIPHPLYHSQITWLVAVI